MRFFGFQNCFKIYPKFVKYWMPFSFFFGGFGALDFFLGGVLVYLGVVLGGSWEDLAACRGGCQVLRGFLLQNIVQLQAACALQSTNDYFVAGPTLSLSLCCVCTYVWAHM